MISIQTVKKQFADFVAVDGISLEIPSGTTFGIIGPNGAGKSTLFRMICQLIQPDQGQITVNGYRDPLRIKACIGFLPEEHHLYESLKSVAYLAYFAELLGLPKSRAMEVLSYVGLEDKAQSKISKLSKGMRQKVAFARTLLADPPVLILDEPTYGLDPRTSRQMRGWIKEAAEKKCVVLSSHNMFESERMCDTVAIVNKGKVVACGSPRSLIQSLKTENVLELRFRGSVDSVRRAILGLKLVAEPVFDEGRVSLYCSMETDPYAVIRHILDGVSQGPSDFGIEALIPREPTLEDVFIHMTGSSASALADNAEGGAS